MACNPTYKGKRYNSMEELYKEVANEEDSKGNYAIDHIGDEPSYSAISQEQQAEPSFDKLIRFKQSLIDKNLNKIRMIETAKKEHAKDSKLIQKLDLIENDTRKRLEGDDLHVGLQQEVFQMKRASDTERLSYYVESDFNNLERLLKSTDPRDVSEAGSIISFYKRMKFDVNQEHPIYTDKRTLYDVNGNLTVPMETKELMDSIYNKAVDYGNILEKKKQDAAINQINNIENVSKLFGRKLTYDEVFNPKNGLRDLTYADMFAMDITNGIFRDNGVIPQAMMYILKSAYEKRQGIASKMNDTVDKILPDVEKALKNLGYTLPTGIGVSYDIFRAKDRYGNYMDRVIHRYTDSYHNDFKKTLDNFHNSLAEAKDLKDPLAAAIMIKKAFTDKDNWFKINTTTIDPRKIPEFFDDEDMQQLKDNFNRDAAPEYKESLIGLLGEQGYKEEIQKAKDNYLAFVSHSNANREEVYDSFGTDNYNELPTEGKQAIDLFDKRNDPLISIDLDNENRPLVVNNKIYNPTKAYTYSVPNRERTVSKLLLNEKTGLYETISKVEPTGYYDSEFDKIESNPALKEFHSILTKFTNFVYSSIPEEDRYKYSAYSIPALNKSLLELVFDKNANGMERLNSARTKLWSNFTKAFTENDPTALSQAKVDPATGKPEYKINGAFLKSNSDLIWSKFNSELLRVKAECTPTDIKTWNNKTTLDLTNAKYRNVVSILAENYGVRDDLQSLKNRLPDVDLKNANINDLLKSAVTNSVVISNSYDLPKIMKLYSFLTAEYMARQSVLPHIQLLKEHYDQLKTPMVNKAGEPLSSDGDGETVLEGERRKGITQMQDFFERAVLGYYPSKNEFTSKKIEEPVTFGKTGINKVDALTSQLQVTVTGNVLDGEEKQYAKMLGETESKLQDMRETTEEDSPEREAIDNELKHIEIMKDRLGKKVTTSSIMNAFFNLQRFLGLGYNAHGGVNNYLQGQLANAFCAASGRYFTGSNIYRANKIVRGARMRLLGKWGKKIMSPEVKKLSVLMDRYDILQDASNELQKASNKSIFQNFQKLSPYKLINSVEYVNQSPLFISIMLDTMIKGKDGTESNVWDAMDEKGMLKPNFATEENKMNWEDMQGSQYIQTKNKIMKCITTTQGDYEKLRGNMSSESITGKALFMFKRFLPRAVYERLAVEQNDIEAGVKSKGWYRSNTQVTAGFQGALLGGIGLGVFGMGPLGALIGGATGTVIGRLYGVHSEMGYAAELANTCKEMALNFLRLPINNITGKSTIPDFNAEKYVKAGVSKTDIEGIRANMMEMTIQLGLLAMLLGAKALFYKDKEDDPDTYQQTMQTHNLLANTIMSLSSQTSMYLNPPQFVQFVSSMASVEFFTNVSKTVLAAQKAMEGEDTIQSGFHAGQSKFMNQMTQTFMPSLLKPGQGFGSSEDRQFNPSPFDSWFFGPEKTAKEEIKRIRAKAKAQLVDEGMDPDDINEYMRENYPTKKPDESYTELLDEYNE